MSPGGERPSPGSEPQGADDSALGRPDAGPAPPPRIVVCAAVIRREARYLVGQRPEGKRHGGMWEFPGGKLLEGETLEEAMVRELREELDLTVLEVGSVLFRIDDPGTPFTIHFAEVRAAGTPRPLEHSALSWHDPDGLGRLELAPADRRFVRGHLGLGGEG